MKKSLLFIVAVIFSFGLHAQKDTVFHASRPIQKSVVSEAAGVNLNIFPVPVRENNFTISSDREISNIKITNIIGQDIFRARFNNPQTITKVILDNPKRGIYLVTVFFSDGGRVVKKILIEESE